MADRKSFFGAFALSSATVIKLAIQVFILPVLARILGPSAYGLVGFALPFILFANMLCDGGMAAALARQMEVSRELESTLFWIASTVSIAVAVLISLAAGPMAHIFHQPGLGPILSSLTIVLVLSATLSVADSRITRTRRFTLFAVGEVAASLIGVVVAIVAALRGFGVWSLVFQQIVFWVVKAAWLFPASGFRPTRQFNLRAAAPYLKYGAHMVGASLGGFASRNAPMLLIAGCLGSFVGGRYALANQLARIPELLIAGPLYLPVFTAAARAQAAGEDLPAFMNRILRVAVTALAPIYCGWVIIADLVLGPLLGPKWAGTETFLQILAPASFVSCLLVLLTAVQQGLGNSETQFRLSFVLAALVGIGSGVGAQFGPAAAIAGICIGTLVTAPLYLRAMQRELKASLGDLLNGSAAPCAAAAVMSVVLLLLRQQTARLADGVELALLIVAGAAVYAPVLLLLSRGRVWEDVKAVLPAPARA